MSLLKEHNARPKIVIESDGLLIEGHPDYIDSDVEMTSDCHGGSVLTSRRHTATFPGGVQVRNFTEYRLVYPEPEPEPRRGVLLEPGAELRPGDVVDVYTAYSDGSPIFPHEETMGLTVASRDSFGWLFESGVLRLSEGVWENNAEVGYEVRLVEAAPRLGKESPWIHILSTRYDEECSLIAHWNERAELYEVHGLIGDGSHVALISEIADWVELEPPASQGKAVA